MISTERKINVPDKITISDGTSKKTITFDTCEALEYLKLCVSLHLWNEEGVI